MNQITILDIFFDILLSLDTIDSEFTDGYSSLDHIHKGLNFSSLDPVDLEIMVEQELLKIRTENGEDAYAMTTLGKKVLQLLKDFYRHPSAL